MEEKLKKLQELQLSVKEKLEIIREKTKDLKIANYKLEAFLNIVNHLSIKDTQFETNKKTIDQTDVTGAILKTRDNNSVFKNIDFFDAPFNETIPIIEHREEKTITETKWTYDKILEKIVEIKNTTIFIKNTHKIVSALNSNIDGLNIENIIKKTGVSKYRCIDIINELTKTTPHILLKKYEQKNYIYYLNI